MHVLVLTVAYPPEIRSASYLMYEFAHELKKNGHKVTVATTMPCYNLVENVDVSDYKRVCEEEGIKVIRVNSLPVHKVAYLLRGISFLVLPFVLSWGVKRNISDKPDVIIVYSPPLTMGVAGAWLKKYFGAKLVLNIHDIFPQNAIDLGILKNHLMIRLFENIERWIYNKVDSITVHSEGNKKFLVRNKKIPQEMIRVVYNWVNWKLFHEATPRLNFRKSQGLDSKLVILFAGVLGPAQGLDVIINVASRVEGKSKSQFVFVGDGTAKKKLEEQARALNLSNVSFCPFVSAEDYPFLLKEVDIGLVCLSKSNKTPVVPGKLIGYMAAGLPVLVVLHKQSDGHAIIQESGAGLSLLPDDEQAIANAVLKLEKDEAARQDMGKRGAEFTRKNYSLEAAVHEYELIFGNMIGG